MNQFDKIPREWYVHPCRAGQKAPMLDDWPNTCQPMGSDFAAGWQDEGCNLGIVAGKSGLVVVDIDTAKDKKGNESALLLDLPDTVQTDTPTGGRHLFYLQPPGDRVGNFTDHLPGIDIKGKAGYVIAPGSTHPDVPGTYAFAPGKSPQEIALAPCPKWLADLRFRRPKGRTTDSVETEVVQGSRNDTMTSLAGALQRSGLSGVALEAALQEENKIRCSPPMEESEVSAIARSVGQYDHDKQRNTTAEYSFADAIEALTPASAKPEREDIYRRMLTLDDGIAADHMLSDITERVVGKRAVINKEWKVVKSEYEKNQKRESRRESEGAADDLANAVADMVVMPKNANNDVEPTDSAFVLQEMRNGEKYMYPFWNDGTASSYVSRSLYMEARKGGNENIDISEQNLGNNSIIREARTRLECRIQTDDGVKHVQTSPAPFYDRRSQQFYTKTDLEKGVLIFRGSNVLQGARVVEKGPTIEERPEAFEKFKKVCGSNWEIILAHCISALVKLDDAKHALVFTAPRNSGKSTLARFVNHLTDGKENVINAGELKGLWPKIFSTRSFVLDNYDELKMFQSPEMNTIIGGTTTGATTVEARYEKSGITAEMGFPIFTTILSDPLQYVETLADRSIMVNHEFQEGLRDFGTDELTALADEFRPHLWHMIMKYVDAIPELPKAPAGIRQKCFASAAYWLRLQHEDGYSEAEAIEYVASFKYERSAEEEADPFTTALNTVICNATDVSGKTAGEMAALMIEHDPESCQNIKSGRERIPLPEVKGKGTVFKARFDKAAAGDRVAGWRFTKDKGADRKVLYTFYRDTS